MLVSYAVPYGPFLSDLWPLNVQILGRGVSVADLMAVVGPQVDQGPVLVLGSQRDEVEMRRVVRRARVALDTVNLVPYCTSLPPLASAVWVSLAGAVTPCLPSAGVAHAALSRLEQHLVVQAWLSRVSGLERPAPSLGQHLRSWLPGASFLASLQPESWVRTTWQARGGALRPAPPSVAAAVATRDGNRAWVDQHVLAGIRREAVVDVASPEDAPQWWGSSRLVEVVVYHADVEALAESLLAELTVGPCRWCATEIASRHCPLCGAAQRDGEEVAA